MGRASCPAEPEPGQCPQGEVTRREVRSQPRPEVQHEAWWEMGRSEGLSEAGEGAWFPGRLFPQGPGTCWGFWGPDSHVSWEVIPYTSPGQGPTG